MMSRLVRRSPYLAATYFDLGRFFTPPESREPLFLRRAARAAFCLSSVSINQSQNSARCGLSMIGRVMYVCTMLSITCARLAHSLSIHYRLITHTRPDAALFRRPTLFVFFRKHLANQHVAMPVALNQNLTFEDAMARRIHLLIHTVKCVSRTRTHSIITNWKF